MIFICPVFSQDRVTDILSVIEKSHKSSASSSSHSSGNAGRDVIDPRLTRAERDAMENRLNSDSPLDILTSENDKAETLIALFDLTDAVINNEHSETNALNNIINSSYLTETPQINVLNQVIQLNSKSSQNSQTGSHKKIFRYNYDRNIKLGPSNAGVLPFIGSEWGRITSGYGYREKYQRMHNGIDIAMPIGDSVRVVMPGIVDRVNFERNGYGCYVVVTHADGYETRYAHLSRCIVNPGDSLFAKQAIAISGNSGNSTGPHLHFEVRQNGIALDPMSVFDFGSLNVKPSQGPALLNGNLADPLQYVVENRVTTGFNGSKKELRTKRTYIVREGDTLSSIASRAGISVLELRKRNFLSSGQNVPVGTMLKLR